jgi:hypothetical protein
MIRLLKTMLLFAMLAGIPTSCMDNRVEVENNASTDLIGFTATTTRAVSADISTLKADVNGFRVYATVSNNLNGWYADEDGKSVDGTNNHRFANNEWGFKNPVKWPKGAVSYPMMFYAVYPFSPAGLEPLQSSFNPLKMTAVYNVQDVGKMEDVMAGQTKVTKFPTSGKVTMVFQHILSKINFGIIGGTGAVLRIQSLQVVNVNSSREFDFLSNNWTGAATSNKTYV